LGTGGKRVLISDFNLPPLKSSSEQFFFFLFSFLGGGVDVGKGNNTLISLRRVGVISVWDMIVLQVSMILPLWLGMICVVTCVEENSLCLARNWKFSHGMNPFPLSL
jgi:hypothetical protein